MPDFRVWWVTGGLFVLCFGVTLIDLVRAWITNPDSAHGLLIAPVCVWLVFKIGRKAGAAPAVWTGIAVLTLAVVASVLGRAIGMATLSRAALVLALVGIALWSGGWRQLLALWLPFVLFVLTIPFPDSLILAITMPLQGIAAQIGAEMLSWRNIPVSLSGNVIQLPGHSLFVSEACSGLRSLTALVSMAILIGAIFLKHSLTRILMVFTSIVLAIVVNGVRVFLTGFLVYFVNPALGEGFMHLSEGYLLFLVSLSALGGITWLYKQGEDRFLVSRFGHSV